MPDITKAPPEKALNREGPFAYSHSPNKESGTESNIFCVVDTSIGWVGVKRKPGCVRWYSQPGLPYGRHTVLPTKVIERAV